ncbi:MAG: XRE family transcriptional regulator [Rhizobiales bacterium 65-9]|nr:helix-turn-helix domain-containing protein [Hyphomicrobiales bacterium]OJY32163.1 MAG: XRE family transcriptional regulator [Rhizobiales bacterium 65-9]
MKELRILRNEDDYDQALTDIAAFFDAPPARKTAQAERFDLLALLIEDYERRNWPIEPPAPIDAIRYRMETAGYSQADLGRLLGSRQRASDILSGRRSLTMAMVRKLHQEWGIPAESLIQSPARDRAA